MKPFYFAILAALVWGVAPLVEKAGLARIEPMAGVIIRSFGVILGAIILAAFNGHIVKSAFSAESKTIVLLALGGIIASILGQVFFYNALKHGEVSKMVPIAATYPLVSFLLGILFFGESFTIVKGLGIGFVIVGVFLLK